ncbi:MAG: zinc ribbon domain-containing protein [Candidatus Nealsonbacteria bacterium]|nr:zinc ribbon domain-containing protein [Candidatus Nealsonbacteria bacterium]
MVKAPQLTEIQDETSLGTEDLPMKRCMGLNCDELIPLDKSFCPKCLPVKRCMGLNCNKKVPHGEYFCPECARKKDSVLKNRKASNNNSNSHRVIRGVNSLASH